MKSRRGGDAGETPALPGGGNRRRRGVPLGNGSESDPQILLGGILFVSRGGLLFMIRAKQQLCPTVLG
jgi:hypothetical protein